MFMICMLLYFLIQIQIPCRALSQSSTRNVTVLHGETANLTFDLRTIANTSILQMEYMSIVYFIGKKSALKGITPDFTIVENNLDRFSISIQNASKHNEGRYCLVVKDERQDHTCVQLIIYEEKKTVVSIYQETGRIEDGNIGLICDAKLWSTNLETHNRTIFYGWFKDDVYITSNRKLTFDDEYILKSRDIICLATDDYDCGRLMDGINKTITLQKVKMDKRCKDLLGISPVYTQKSNYKLEIKEPYNTVKEVIIGKTVTIRWTIFGYPEPIIKPAFNKSHSGHRLIGVSMVKTQTRHEYSLTLTIPVISQYDLGKYCIQVKSRKETLNLCQTLTKSSIVSEQISVPIVISAAVVLILVIFGVILVIRVCQGKQAIVSEDISLSEVGGPYEKLTEDDVIQSLQSVDD